MYCPNKNDKQFKKMVEHLGDDLAYHIWHANNGHSIELTKEGEPSELYNSLMKAYVNEKQAYEAKNKTFSNAFRKWHGSDEEPKLDGNRIVNAKGEGIDIVGSKEPEKPQAPKEDVKKEPEVKTQSIAELAKAAVSKAEKQQEKEITDTDSKIQNNESKPKITVKAEKIDDIGEKIGGAKKDLFKEYQKKLAETTNEDISKLPLSKSFPRPNFAQLVEEGKMTQETSIFLSYFYDEIPTKPQKTYRVKAWVDKVRGALDVFNTVLGKKPDRDLMQEFIDKMNSDKYSGSVAFQAESYRAIKKAINFPNNEVNTGNLSIGRYYDTNGKYTYAVKIPVGDRVRLSERYDTLDKAVSKLIEMSKESLPDIVGKEAAKKLLETPIKTDVIGNPITYGIKGDNMKFGGEGIKAFYDGIVPSAMNKLGKPFGAKVEDVDIPLHKPTYEITIKNKLGNVSTHEFDSKAQKDQYIKDNKNDFELLNDQVNETNVTNQFIPVTDSMKESVMAGIPLFKINSETFDTAKTNEERFTAGKEIVDGLDQMLGYETSTVKNDDALVDIMPEFEEKIRTHRVGGSYYEGKAIINTQHHDTGNSVVESYFHEHTHEIVCNQNTKEEIIEFYRSLPEKEKKLLAKEYANADEYVAGHEILARTIEDLVKKYGYEEVINGNVDLSLYSEPLQNELQQIIETYGNNKNINDGRRNSISDNITGETTGDIQEPFEQRKGSDGEKTLGTSDTVAGGVQKTESGGSAGILPGTDEIKPPFFKIKGEKDDTPTPPKYSAEKAVGDYAVEIDKYNKRLEAIEYRKKQIKEDHDEKKITNVDFAKGVKDLSDEKFDIQTKIKRIKAGTNTPEELEGKKTGDGKDNVDPVEHQAASGIKKPLWKDFKPNLAKYTLAIAEYHRKKWEEKGALAKAESEAADQEPQLKDFVGRPYSDYESALAQYRTARAVLKNEPIPEIKKQYRTIVQGLKTAKDEIVSTDIPEIRTLYRDMESDWLGNRDVEKAKAMVEAKTLQDQIKATVKDSKQKWQDVDKAIHVYIDMKNDPTAADRYYDELTDPQKHIIDIAKQLTPEQTAIADKIAKEYENLCKKALDEEVISNVYDNYVRRQWDITGEKERDYFAKFSTTTSHAKQRKLTSIIEGWAGGLNLKTEGATNNLQALKEEINAVIENKKLLEAGMAMKGENGVPLFTLTNETGYEEIKHPNFRKWVQWKKVDGSNNISGENWAIDKDGNIFEKKKIYAPKEIADRINNILTPYDNGLTGFPKKVVNSLDKLNAVAKSTILSFSFYHHQAFARQYMFGAVFNGPKDVNLFSAYKEGFDLFMNMSPEVEMLIRGGITVGRIQDWKKDLVEKKEMIRKPLNK